MNNLKGRPVVLTKKIVEIDGSAYILFSEEELEKMGIKLGDEIDITQIKKVSKNK